MSFRFVRITNYYTEYIKSYYNKHTNIHNESYDFQYSHLINNSIESASSYTKQFYKVGIEAYDIISNASFLQETWKKENSIPTEISTNELIIKQLKHYKPNVIWIDDFSIINLDWKNQLLKEVPSVKLILGHICAPYNSVIANKFKLFDIMFTCIPCFKAEIKKMGVKTVLLYHSFDKSVLERINYSNSKTDLIFTGSLYTGYGFHKSRIEYIEKLLDAHIQVGIFGNLESQKKIFAKQIFYKTVNLMKLIGGNHLIENIPLLEKYKSYGDTPIENYSKKLLKNTNSPLFGLDMFNQLANSKICFNIHGEIAQKCAGNIRLFEATGVGTCLITDYKDNITDLFEPDKEIVTYNSIDECIEKVKWLLNNDYTRNEIAQAGQKRTLENHTIENRINIITEQIISTLKEKY